MCGQAKLEQPKFVENWFGVAGYEVTSLIKNGDPVLNKTLSNEVTPHKGQVNRYGMTGCEATPLIKSGDPNPYATYLLIQCIASNTLQ